MSLFSVVEATSWDASGAVAGVSSGSEEESMSNDVFLNDFLTNKPT